jgi:hypothetical protein
MPVPYRKYLTVLFNNIIFERVQRLGPMCVEIQVKKILTLNYGVCCVGFINPIEAIAGVRRQLLALSIGPN